jgi:hypothetical protein
MNDRLLRTALLLISLSCSALAQEANSGISVPMTISGNARYNDSSEDNRVSGGLRALIAPRLQLGQHWSAYSIVGGESSNYWSYAMGLKNDRPVGFDLLQAYVGYEQQIGSATILIKGGRLSSAFGHFPLEYEDAKTALIEPPSMFIANLPLRPDQLPCGVRNIVWQDYDQPVAFSCGGSTAERYGIVPVTLYGIPGLETQISWNRVDARVQMTNSSPANPQSLLSHSQSLQWTMGVGYSWKAGLHVGVSGFRGPWLDFDLFPVISSTNLNRFKASGLGLDVQWFGGPWSVQGEWQRFRFSLPGFAEAPSTQGGYAQVKRTISPRTYVAFRTTYLRPGGAVDGTGLSVSQIDSHQQVQEFVLGYRVNRLQLMKLGFSLKDRNDWTLGSGYWPGERHWAAQCQLVTSINGLVKAFR